MSVSRIRRAATRGIAAAALTVAAVTLVPGVASAHPAASAAPAIASSCGVGQVPLTNQNTWVRGGPGFAFGPMYTIPAWFGFRIVAGPASADGLIWWYGHGNGQADGWVPQQNLTCN